MHGRRAPVGTRLSLQEVSTRCPSGRAARKLRGPDVLPGEQRENYEARVKGSRKLRRFIDDARLQHIACPRKYLHELPKKFRHHGQAAYVLVVERLDILGKEESARRYHDVADPVLRDLLRVLVKFKGLDSNSKNVQFTKGGQIAFVDLENWGRTDRDEVRLKSIGTYLSKDRLRLAREILDELE